MRTDLAIFMMGLGVLLGVGALWGTLPEWLGPILFIAAGLWMISAESEKSKHSAEEEELRRLRRQAGLRD